jgi:cobyrinic acid a,c-diamide synthase
MRGFLIAAPHSGSGKTVLTLALLRAFAKRGFKVASAKAGPDYIDPAFHAAATGVPSVNLDPWAMRPELVSALAARKAPPGTMLIVEGMMGLFDGAADGSGTAADLARETGLPVVLVIDASHMGHSVAPLVRGFADYRQDIHVAGVILNKVGSDRHAEMLTGALDKIGISVFGCVRRDARLALPERHLGLVQAVEHEALSDFLDRAAEYVSSVVDLERLANLSRLGGQDDVSAGVPRLPPLGQRIAVARDRAFAFAYPHIIEGWQRRGASVTFFSPLADEAPHADADAIYLPGGYPELHGGHLAAAETFRAGMLRAAEEDKTIYGECGGYMVLGRSIVDGGGSDHRMLGLLPLDTSFAAPRLHLGYRVMTPLQGAPFSSVLRGHEFHYASVVDEGEGDRLFSVTDALGSELGSVGLRRGSVCGSFQHIIDLQPAQ